MTKTILLQRMKEVVEEAVKDLILPVRIQKDEETPEPRAAQVYLARLPDKASATKKAPYIVLQPVAGEDKQEPGQRREASCLVRLVFTVFHPDGQEGGLALLEMMERVRVAFLTNPNIGKQFSLVESEGLEWGINYELDPPYYNGEMVGRWTLPAVEREDIQSCLERNLWKRQSP